MPSKQIVDYYAEAGRMTSTGRYTSLIEKLPDDLKELTQIIQGLAIHQYTAHQFYGVNISEIRENEAHMRYAEDMISTILELNSMPLVSPRKPEERIIGVCHHFAKLLVSILRTKNIPARIRYGFGDYFNQGYFEDHSLCEYWNEKEKRWILVDPQFDKVWQKELHIKHDVFDVPRNHFLTAGDAWIKCRAGELDANTFGIFHGNMRGLWFIAGNIIKDIAALNKIEMLQWDAWTGMPRPNNTMKDKKRLEFFDYIATLTQDPDENFRKIQEIYKDKTVKINVPDRVFNAMRRHLEKV